MNATLFLLAPALLGQVSLPTGIGGRVGGPPVIITSPQGGSLPQTRSFDLGSSLKSSIPDIRTPQLDIPSNNSGAVAAGSGTLGDSSTLNPSSAPPVTASRADEITTSVATPSGMVPPPPHEIHEAPPDGGDEDDDDDKGAAPGFEWGKTLALIVVGALFLYGLTRP